MQTYRLKNIIILILVMVNACLLVLLLQRQSAQRQAWEESRTQIAALFRSESIALEPGDIPAGESLPPVSFTRSAEREKALAEAILGDGLIASDEGGGIYVYTGDSGTARFRSNGAFDITVIRAPREEPEALCRRICRDFSYGEAEAVFSAGTTVYTAPLLSGGAEVVNCTVTFRFTGNILTAVSGFVLPEKSVAAAGEPMSAVTALTLLLQSRSTSGAIASTVTAITPAYVLESTPAAPLALTPVWLISTDTYEYYVNCASRAVSHN